MIPHEVAVLATCLAENTPEVTRTEEAWIEIAYKLVERLRHEGYKVVPHAGV